MIACCIFDLDGVLVDTAKYHYLAWAALARELYWEGFRRTTLIRFDRFTSGTFLWPFKGGVQSGQALADHLRLFPIPSDDLLVNDNLVQNPGY